MRRVAARFAEIAPWDWRCRCHGCDGARHQSSPARLRWSTAENADTETEYCPGNGCRGLVTERIGVICACDPARRNDDYPSRWFVAAHPRWIRDGWSNLLRCPYHRGIQRNRLGLSCLRSQCVHEPIAGAATPLRAWQLGRYHQQRYLQFGLRYCRFIIALCNRRACHSVCSTRQYVRRGRYLLRRCCLLWFPLCRSEVQRSALRRLWHCLRWVLDLPEWRLRAR